MEDLSTWKHFIAVLCERTAHEPPAVERVPRESTCALPELCLPRLSLVCVTNYTNSDDVIQTSDAIYEPPARLLDPSPCSLPFLLSRSRSRPDMAYHRISRQIKRAILNMRMRGLNNDEIQRLLLVHYSERSYRRWRALFNETGLVYRHRRTWKDSGRPIHLGVVEQIVLMDILYHEPDLYLDEIARRLYERGVAMPAVWTVSRTFNRMRWIHVKKDVLNIAAYKARITRYVPEMLCFGDETTVQARSLQRIRGWAPRGDRVKRLIRHVGSGKRYTVLPIITIHVMLTFTVQPGAMTSSDFKRFWPGQGRASALLFLL